MLDYITVPNFDTGPEAYNLIKAKDKNDQGLCGVQDCNNFLGTPKGLEAWCSIQCCDECFNKRKGIWEKYRNEDFLALVSTIQNLKSISERSGEAPT